MEQGKSIGNSIVDSGNEHVMITGSRVLAGNGTGIGNSSGNDGGQGNHCGNRNSNCKGDGRS